MIASDCAVNRARWSCSQHAYTSTIVRSMSFNSAQGNLSVDNGAGGRITAIEGDASPNAPNGLRQLQFGARFTF